MIEYLSLTSDSLTDRYGMAADWWSVGVLLFEMLTGKHPFSARNRQTLQKKILTEKLKIPPYLTAESARLG